MAFYESPRFPERIGIGATGGPSFATEVIAVESGREKRNARWSYPRHEWDVSHGLRSQADFVTLREFFLATAKGKAHGWRYKDWADFAATIAQGVVAGLTSTTFQLIKRYTSGAQTTDRPITKPIAAGFVLKDTGATLVLTTDYTLNTVTGVVTTVIPRTAANLTWSGSFDVPMRFDTDKLNGSMIGRNGSDLVFAWDSIPIIELPV